MAKRVKVSNHADSFTGSNSAEKICGLGGMDHLWGRGGNDTILGGNGKDTLDGGVRNHKLCGENGKNNPVGGDDSDLLYVISEVESNNYVFIDTDGDHADDTAVLHACTTGVTNADIISHQAIE